MNNKFLLMALAIPSVLLADSMPESMIEAISNHGLVFVNKLTPNILSSDFNGDGKSEATVYIQDKKSQMYGLCIINSENDKCTIIAAGNDFYGVGNNFNWVDSWEVVQPGQTWETTFSANGDIEGEKTVNLQYSSVRLCANEGGCGIVTYNQGEYLWVHQGD